MFITKTPDMFCIVWKSQSDFHTMQNMMILISAAPGQAYDDGKHPNQQAK
jgi:hypothetical protein